MLAIGKDVGLMRQIGAAGIDEIDAGQPVLQRDLLRPQMLFDRHRIIGAALDGGIVGDDHRLAAGDAADAGDEPGAVDVAFVHAVGGERAHLQERRARIEPSGDALARHQLAAREMPLARLFPAAFGRRRAAALEIVERLHPARLVFGVGGAVRAWAQADDRHGRPLTCFYITRKTCLIYLTSRQILPIWV